MVMLSREARFTRYQSQLLQVMLIWLLIALLNVFIARERSPHSFITFFPSVAYFISHYLLLIRRKWIAEMMLWLFILAIVGIGALARWNKIDRVDYSNLLLKNQEKKMEVEDKRILILSDRMDLYQSNTMASYFLNWNLSKEIFELNHYYNDLVLINESFQKDPPDVIIDERDQMKKIFSRLPLLAKQYERKGNCYERKK
jgi:ABC-type multidrug transport system fused ATPase/permease subunit